MKHYNVLLNKDFMKDVFLFPRTSFYTAVIYSQSIIPEERNSFVHESGHFNILEGFHS